MRRDQTCDHTREFGGRDAFVTEWPRGRLLAATWPPSDLQSASALAQHTLLLRCRRLRRPRIGRCHPPAACLNAAAAARGPSATPCAAAASSSQHSCSQSPAASTCSRAVIKAPQPAVRGRGAPRPACRTHTPCRAGARQPPKLSPALPNCPSDPATTQSSASSATATTAHHAHLLQQCRLHRPRLHRPSASAPASATTPAAPSAVATQSSKHHCSQVGDVGGPSLQTPLKIRLAVALPLPLPLPAASTVCVVFVPGSAPVTPGAGPAGAGG